MREQDYPRVTSRSKRGWNLLRRAKPFWLVHQGVTYYVDRGGWAPADGRQKDPARPRPGAPGPRQAARQVMGIDTRPPKVRVGRGISSTLTNSMRRRESTTGNEVN